MKWRSALVCLLLAAPLYAQQQKSEAELGVERLLRSGAEAVQARFLGGARSLDEWAERLPLLRRQYLDMLGLWPLPEKTPLKATTTGTVARGDVAIEKLHFQSMPGLYVTGNLYRPKEVKKPLPTILYLCGHSGKGRDGNKTAFQDHGMWFARNGYVCLIIDTLQLGEVKGVHHGTYNLKRWHWHSLAYTPAGVECWNGVRAIDYLLTRKDVDRDKIGVTGISGGGAVTIWIAAADERVKVAVPVSGMSDLKSYVGNKVINGHCDCMFLVNLYGWEWTTIAALIAPRPLLFANSDDDNIFPMDGNRRIIARLRTLYRGYGKGALVDEHVSKGGHAYRPDLRVAIFSFINKHLKGDKAAVKDADDEPLPGKELRVFPEDKDLPKDSINDRIDESFIKVAKVAPPKEKEFAQWKAGLMGKLRETSFRAFPERLPKAVAIDSSPSKTKNGLRGHYLYPEWDVQTFLSLPVRDAPRSKKGMLVVLNDGEDKHALPEWLSGLSDEYEVRLFVPRGVGPVAWPQGSPPNYVARSFALLGETVDQNRVRDVVAAVRWLQQEGSPRDWSVAGSGQAGVLAAYAALFEPSIAGVVAHDPPASHRKGPHFLGVLRILDVPEAMGLLAPRRLTLAGDVDRAFDRTAAIYRAAGAGKRLTMPKR
jgi:cephalosporin-C deacetylase-like acetyl esterase